VLGIFIAFLFYIKNTSIPHNLVSKFPFVYKLLFNKYYVDEAYNTIFVNPTISGAETIYKHFDLRVIDGAVNGTAKTTNLTGKILSYLHSGLLKDYALIFLLGVILIIGYIIFYNELSNTEFHHFFPTCRRSFTHIYKQGKRESVALPCYDNFCDQFHCIPFSLYKI
jgi:hypothetical protein